jgi:hypothetical protein
MESREVSQDLVLVGASALLIAAIAVNALRRSGGNAVFAAEFFFNVTKYSGLLVGPYISLHLPAIGIFYIEFRNTLFGIKIRTQLFAIC